MDNVTVTIPQMPAFIRAIVATPNEELKAMRRSLSKGVKKIRTNFIRTQLQGPPGIAAGKLAKGKNVFTYVNGSSLQTLGAKIGISRILHVHEVGLTISAKGHGLLFLHEKGRGPVFAVVPKVRIPARLRFRAEVAAEAPPMLAQVGLSALDATRTTLQKGLLQGI